MQVILKRGIRASIDLVMLALAFVLAHWLRFDRSIPSDQMVRLLVSLPYVVLLKYALLSIQQVHRHSWRYTSLTEIVAITRAMLAAAMVLTAGRILAPALQSVTSLAVYLQTPYVAIVMDFALSVLLLLSARAFRRLLSEQREQAAVYTRTQRDTFQRVLLIGAGRAGVMVARELRQRPDLRMRAIGFVDDDVHKQGQIIHGIPVIGTTDDIPDIVAGRHPDKAIITIASADGATVRRIHGCCTEVGLDTEIIPGIYEIVGGRVELSRIRPVAIEDLLGRDPVELDVSAIRQYVAHDVVMVTGAGGSIGSELCRQLARFDPRTLVLVEQAENALWAIHRELEKEFPELELVPAIADVTDAVRIEHLFLQLRPAAVFHAAAHKHVPMMEWNPGEAIKNNVLGTKTVADAAATHGVQRFVMISTDKAVNPTSVMGATKRIAERYVQHLAQRTGRPFVSVRFGNVLGSNGSVIPVFKEQIARGGPVTVTHREMVRYFMTIPEASQLVLQAGALGASGEIFVLDMGEPVRIVDLARDLIRLSGFEPDVDIAIEFTGMRPGEKMFEELSLSEEHAERTVHPKIWVGSASEPAWSTAEEELVALAEGAERLDRDDAHLTLARLVPEFQLPAVDPTALDTATFLARQIDQ